ncbi:hypothetical protein I584_02696 [Enterococcus hirae ATCC 9790]|uniref:LPXTG cell wall anchor domain-containing protein n=1 Tax=Enterococcus hirae TaxID=1354 RepID=A0A7Z9AWH0_ENTHR|nr:LPXTG cell wall anchor domain-containing protein [Enterococcus hirae]EOH67151.1 LPXTG-domain-containing protein cell wall anchor domain [Enterococcus hirae ATCC 9790]EOH67157.1 LPXTG-domain-containing protein cell wall anchor domain [Enterococcus hirae ATCC 9790]EOU03883.1 hypothetical protein I584_02696 [Enterococcus hirae ATCC 9790]VTQ73755.1 Uncharacterised protein [Enterococcus hirae]
MLVEAVHVQPAHGRINDSVYLKNKIFTFRVAEKLEKKLQKGMLVYSKDGQLVYVKNIISGRSEKEENEYIAIISKIFNENRSSGASKNQTVVDNYQETKKQEPKKLSVNGNHTYFPKTNDKTNRWVTLIGGIVVMSGIGCAILANKREKSPNKLFDDYVK